MQNIPLIVIILAIALFMVLISSIRILREYERGVIFRFGRLARAFINLGGTGNGPGLIILIPFIDRMVTVSLRTIVMDVPPQDIITKDNVSLKVNAVVYFRVVDPQKAIIEVENYLFATSQLSQTTLRSVVGQSELDDLLGEREKINKQAEAERERRSKIIAAEGEFQASQRLSEAAKILSEQPSAITLRYLQTLREIATENNSTTIFPVPVDILKPFLQSQGEQKK